MDVRINNAAVYSSSTGLYVANGDHNLLEIVGDDVPLVEGILLGLAAVEPLDGIFERFRVTCNNEREYFDEVVSWLVEQGILLSAQTEDVSSITTFLHAPYLEESVRAEITAHLSKTGSRDYVPVADYKEAQLILLFAPLFEHQAEVQRLNKYAYQNQIPLCHIGVDSGTFTIGPLVHAAIGTPCLNCYLWRKIANLKNPDKTLAFIRHPDKSKLLNTDPRSNPYFKVALTHLAVEINTFFASKGTFCTLLGKSITFNHFEYDVMKSRILRLPHCEVCSTESAYYALNS